MSLDLTQIIRKGFTSTSLIKRYQIRNPKVDLIPKIVTLKTITKVTLFIKGTIATLVIGIQVILVLVKVTNTIENSVVKRPLT